MLKQYEVVILVNVSGYEKQVMARVEANNEEDAMYEALCNETHNEPLTREQYDNGDEWWDDIFIYVIDSCNLITE